MTLEGTVVNGQIVLDAGTSLPEGARVRIELEPDDELDNLPPPPQTETYEEHLAMLRQSIEEAKAGIGGMTLTEFEAELKKEFSYPPAAPKK